MKLTLGFSPCPNDTFIFDAMIHHKIDTEGLSFEFSMEDVETLNNQVIQRIPDISKISFNAFLHIVNDYVLLNSGSAIGMNCGPLLIGKKQFSLNNMSQLKVAIPGKNTTANLLLSILLPEIEHKQEMVFSAIEDAVLKDSTDAGLIIHENRFTYEKKGLKKIADLGELWMELTQTPIPLGGIVVKRSLSTEMIKKIDRIMKRSVQYALDNPLSSAYFVKQNAQELDDAVIQKHIELYVNNFTVNLGGEGKEAILTLFKKVRESEFSVDLKNDIFVE